MPDEPEIDSDRAPIRFKPKASCPHRNFLVDSVRPEVTCEACEAVLDPYWCIRQYAFYYQSIDYRLAEMKRVEQRLEERSERERQRRLKRRMRDCGVRGVVEGA